MPISGKCTRHCANGWSLHLARPEPGFGFVTLCPHTETEPEILIVPLGSIRQLTITQAEAERRVGFSLPDDG